ncbi:MAG: PEP-CTERM sorting domain-containing protein [Timaviella obliquedivisa GSE-PSE-MK23-08B]|jgi:hypothetical protein|nr:PEP-CTERM sorting domain-containing protein [Timaviella obliquedivisa GSE-PSE-MK23-08B]
MKLQIASTLSLIAATLSLATAPAQAFSGFAFTTDYSPKPADPKRDIMLESVTIKSTGEKIGHFELVNKATIITNGTAIGPGSSDRGDLATGQAPLENATSASVVGSLGNLNLNNIIDTEDNLGESVIDVYFKSAAKRFFFFERGVNSDLKVDALDKDGNVVSTYTITRALFKGDKGANLTGYSIDTTEIGGAQKVGSYGLELGYKVAGLRLSSNNTMNGPDYKVVAAKVPEPATIAALGAVVGLAALTRRQKKQAVSAQ